MTTVALAPFPVFRVFDANGVPLAGGLVYTYNSGTTAPAVTYGDFGGTVNNTNPVVLDSTGSALIYYANQFYTVTVTDANNVQQFSVDGVGPGPTGSSTAGGIGAATQIQSNTLVDLGVVSSQFAEITGTNTISNFGSTATLGAPLYLIKFDSVLTITASGLILTPTGQNITTAQNDHAWVEYLGNGTWRIFDYMAADGSVNTLGTITCGTLTVLNTANLP